MIKDKFLKFLLWFKEHFRFLLEVVFRLSVGIEKHNETNTNDGGNDYDK